MADKRIIEQVASTELYNDDYFIKDSALEGTRKISQSKLKELFLDGTLTLEDLSSASAWTTNTYYDRDSVVYHDGKLYRNLSGKRLHEAEFSTDDWTEIASDFVKMINNLQDSMAGGWMNTQTYYQGDYAFYNGHYYRCVSTTTPGTWQSNKWMQTSLHSEIIQYLWKFAQYMDISSQSSLHAYSKGELAIRSIDHVDHLLMAKDDYPQGVTEFDPDQWVDLSSSDEEWISGLSKELVGRIDDVASDIPTTAEDLAYDNTESGLTADNVQDAIGEVLEEGGKVQDVKVDGTSVVDTNKIAQISLATQTMKGTVSNLPQPIASFSDGADAPLNSLTASIVPVQDLHGYDSPWVGGAGKNLFNMGSKWSGTASGLTFTTDDNYININGTKNGGTYVTPTQLYFDLPAGTYYAKVFVISGTTSNAPSVYVYSNQELTPNMLNTERSFTIESQTSVGIRFAFWNDGATFNNYKLGIVISKTSNIDKFYPYSNICPISGWTEEVVTRCGKNLFDKTATDTNKGFISGKWINKTGNTFLYSDWSVSEYIRVDGEKIAVSGMTVAEQVSSGRGGYCCYDKYKNVLGGGTYNALTQIITLPTNTEYIRISVWNHNKDVCQLELSETATTYEPYAGTTTTIPFTDGQGNPVEVFGGSVDVVNGGGSAYKEYPSYNGETLIGPWISDRDVYAPNTTPTTGAQVVDMGDTTTFYTQPTSIKSLDGVNNVFASTGDVEECVYTRDATTTINQILARLDALEG